MNEQYKSTIDADRAPVIEPGHTFGNLNDPDSAVSKQKAKERDYQVLADLNYRPRTTYTAGVINPNPELA